MNAVIYSALINWVFANATLVKELYKTWEDYLHNIGGVETLRQLGYN